MACPALNRKVEIRIPGEPRWLASRVEEVDELLTISAPTGSGGVPAVLVPGAAVALRWTERRGIGLLDAVVAGTQVVPVPVWHLRATGDGEIVQRRRYARVPVSLPTKVACVYGRASGGPTGVSGSLIPGVEWDLVTLDLSEGGMRATALAGPFLVAGPDDRFLVSVEVDGHTVHARARVVRCAVVKNAMVVTFCFTDITRADGDHLRRYVFARELRLRDVLR